MIDNVSARSIRANPVALGLACFGITVFMLSAYLWGAIQSTALVSTALFVGGAGMLGVGIAAYRRGDDLDSTWMSAFGLFWASLAFYMWFFAPRATNIGLDLAWLAFAWGIFTAYIFVVSLRARSPLVSAQLVLFFVLFLFMWISGAFHVGGADRVAAIAGFITAILAAIESCAAAWLGTTGDSPSLTRSSAGAFQQTPRPT